MQDKSKEFVLWFDQIGVEDVALVGGKNASLGEMYRNLTPQGVRIPNGFALTAAAYRFFLDKTGLKDEIKRILVGLDTHSIRDLQTRGKAVRRAILRATLPAEIQDALRTAYQSLELAYAKDVDVAVRSSATAEDLPGASFAGAQETYLNVVGVPGVIEAAKQCIASLFTDRAISYREDKGFSHFDIALSVGVQKMVRSDKAVSGVAFTIDTESGFDKVVIINASYGLGEMIVKGRVTPDEYIVFKPTLEQGRPAILSRTIGQKAIKLIYSGTGGTVEQPVHRNEQLALCLTDNEVLELARWCSTVEKHYTGKYGRYMPMDLEWAKDGAMNQLFIVQARPETVHASADRSIYREYRLDKKGEALVTGAAVGTKVATGAVRVIRDTRHIESFKKGEILVTQITDPDWEPIMKIASAIVTDKGGRTSHAAIVSRELGIPCIVGSGNATNVLRDGEKVTVDCSSGEVGTVYRGELPFSVLEHRLDNIPRTRTKVMVNIGSPDEAFKNHYLPVSGVGLGRLEFVIISHIRIHPNALINHAALAASRIAHERHVAREVATLTAGWEDKREYYVRGLMEGIAKLGAAFWPNDVIIRFSDFKTNEYRTLLGGDLYEPAEENPMLGWRGASRYYDSKFQEAFGLECEAIKRVREEIGLGNIVPMVPFCRTPDEGRQVLEIMKLHGLDRAHGLRVYVMCEIPSNILRADEFLDNFDGMSIGSNDLTQLTLGLDRDSGIVTHIANENDPAVKKLIAEIIAKCKTRGKYIGICGQAPSDYPEFAQFLVDQGIESISLNPDTVIKTIIKIKEQEDKTHL